MRVPLRFDSVRIGIGDITISRKTSLRTFVYLMEAGGISCGLSGEDTVLIEDTALLHNLLGRSYIRFSPSEQGYLLFSGIRLVIDPDKYPGLKDGDGGNAMNLIRDFVTVSLSDRLGAMAEKDQKSAGIGFRKIAENVYESTYVRIRHEMDRYNAVITLTYREKPAETEEHKDPATDALLARMDELERRLDTVEKENKELRKVNDVVLDLFGSMKQAHDLKSSVAPDDMEPLHLLQSGSGSTGETMNAARRAALINRYW